MSENPLVQALAFGPPPVGETPDRIMIRPPRILRSDVRELENGMRLMPGMAVNFRGSGTIKMIDEDGDILINVTRIDGELQTGGTVVASRNFFLPPGATVTDIIFRLAGSGPITVHAYWLTPSGSPATGWVLTPIATLAGSVVADTVLFSGSSAMPLGGRLLLRVDMSAGSRLIHAFVGYNSITQTLDESAS